jgi:hypothetical protein
MWGGVKSFFRNVLVFLDRVSHKASGAYPAIWQSLKFIGSLVLSTLCVRKVPFLAIALSTTPFVRSFKTDYGKVIAGFIGAILGYGLLSSGLFFTGDIVIGLTAFAILDMFRVWGSRIEEVAVEEMAVPNGV